MKLSNPLVTVMAGALMAVSLSACSKDDKAAEAKSSKAPEITSTAVGTETVKGITGQNNEQKQVSYMIGMDIAKNGKLHQGGVAKIELFMHPAAMQEVNDPLIQSRRSQEGMVEIREGWERWARSTRACADA